VAALNGEIVRDFAFNALTRAPLFEPLFHDTKIEAKNSIFSVHSAPGGWG
jgi:hypothetical protein